MDDSVDVIESRTSFSKGATSRWGGGKVSFTGLRRTADPANHPASPEAPIMRHVLREGWPKGDTGDLDSRSSFPSAEHEREKKGEIGLKLVSEAGEKDEDL